MGIKAMSLPVDALLRHGTPGWDVVLRGLSEPMPEDASVVAAYMEEGRVNLLLSSATWPESKWLCHIGGPLRVRHPDGTLER